MKVERLGTPNFDLASRQPGTKFPLDGYDITKVPNETLIELFKTAPLLHDYQGTRIVRLSRTLALKGGELTRPCEAEIMKLVEAETSIPVPKIHRVLNTKTQNTFFGCQCYFVMDFIEGDTVQDCWEGLSHALREDVVSQVASMFLALQSAEVPQQPGPVACQLCKAKGFSREMPTETTKIHRGTQRTCAMQLKLTYHSRNKKRSDNSDYEASSDDDDDEGLDPDTDWEQEERVSKSM
ncbi:hypothetical protein MaudMau93_006004 [Microsporum audouinii]